MPLPLGCDESTLSHMEKSTRMIYLFFLAETSLKEILDRIHSTYLESLSETVQQSTIVRVSPVALELKSQLASWENSLPQSLDWSPEPIHDAHSPLHTRLRLNFWLAHFRLSQPLITRVTNNVHAEFNVEVWTSLMHGLSSGYTLVKVLIWEAKQLDAVIGKR